MGAADDRFLQMFFEEARELLLSLEEGLMEQSEYPEMSGHLVLHQEFIERLTRLTDRNERGAAVTIAVMQFLKDWLLEHIQVEDKRLTRHLKDHKAGKPKAPV